MCLRRACARLRMSLVTPPGDPGIRSHHTGLSTPTTVRTGLHYAFSNDPGCTTLSQIIVATDARIVLEASLTFYHVLPR